MDMNGEWYNPSQSSSGHVSMMNGMIVFSVLVGFVGIYRLITSSRRSKKGYFPIHEHEEKN